MTTPNRRVAALAAALVWALGCGDSGDGLPRRPVTGTVTLDGKPLPDGSVTLVPLGNGPAVGATVIAGEFAIPTEGGPVPGPYRVQVLSIQATGRTVPDPEGPKGATVAERKNVVPDRYGRRSVLKADVTADGPNAFHFEIASTPDKAPARRRR